MSFSLILRLMIAPLLIWSSSSLATPQDPRQDSHEQATEAFQQLHFFRDGRGMILSPGLITYADSVLRPEKGFLNRQIARMVEKRWGLTFVNGQISGLFNQPYKDLEVGVIGCVACHGGKAAGQYIVGLGNKNIDVLKMAKDVHRLEKWWKSLAFKTKSPDYKKVENAAMDFSSYLAREDLGNLTQGLVPVSYIRGWFYRMHNLEVPSDLPKGQVKIPHLWGYELKRQQGQFCDGYGNGVKAGWAVAVELAAGQTPETVRKYYHEVEEAELLFNDFLPPAYPFAIDQDLAQHGHNIFNQTCARCHGTYETDPSGHPIYQAPQFIPWKVVQTDRDRLDGNTDEFNALVDSNPLNQIVQYNAHLGDGFFAPRLEGIWSRFPYLHNGSVPNIRSLLTPPEERPEYFSLEEAGERHRFSEKDLGLTLPDSRWQESRLKRKAWMKHRDVYDVYRVGHSNQGHNFFTDLPENDKSALIEYLKTL